MRKLATFAAGVAMALTLGVGEAQASNPVPGGGKTQQTFNQLFSCRTIGDLRTDHYADLAVDLRWKLTPQKAKKKDKYTHPAEITLTWRNRRDYRIGYVALKYAHGKRHTLYDSRPVFVFNPLDVEPKKVDLLKQANWPLNITMAQWKRVTEQPHFVMTYVTYRWDGHQNIWLSRYDECFTTPYLK